MGKNEYELPGPAPEFKEFYNTDGLSINITTENKQLNTLLDILHILERIVTILEQD